MAIYGLMTITPFGYPYRHRIDTVLSPTNITKRPSQTYAHLFQATDLAPRANISRRCSKPLSNPLPPHRRLAIIPSQQTEYPPLLSRFFLSCDMGDQSGSAYFQTLFDSALQAYEKDTGVPLAEHPLAAQLQGCHSVESITTLLQHQTKHFSDFRGKNRIMKLIKSTVPILSTISANPAIGGSIGLVRQNALTGCSTSLTSFCRHSHPQMPYKLGSPSYSLYVPVIVPRCISS